MVHADRQTVLVGAQDATVKVGVANYPSHMYVPAYTHTHLVLYDLAVCPFQ